MKHIPDKQEEEENIRERERESIGGNARESENDADIYILNTIT